MSIDDLEISFNPRLSVPNFETYLRNSRELAKKAERELNVDINVSYGSSHLQKLDVFYKKNTKNLPIHIFIHGGYWRALYKSYHSHMALPFIKKGICFFNINYDLCPAVKLTEIKNQIIKAIIWIINNAANFNGNKENIVISGHSAGAHLASLMLSTNWKKYGFAANPLKGVALISGIYETEIIPSLTVNNEIQLSYEEASNNNPFKLEPKFIIPTIISFGDDEPELWKAQSIKYMKYLNLNGYNCKKIVCKDDNHFSLIDTLADYNHLLVKEIINLSF